jgi:hypothetical protein
MNKIKMRLKEKSSFFSKRDGVGTSNDTSSKIQFNQNRMSKLLIQLQKSLNRKIFLKTYLIWPNLT